MAPGTCAKCKDPLVVEIELDDDDMNMAGGSSSASSPPTVPDDVHLPCNCHVHWDCLTTFPESMSSEAQLTQCPACAQQLLTTSSHGMPQILVEYHNEGGDQKDLDVLPILREEAYVRFHPNERKARAFLELCREGDHRAVAGLLFNDDEDDEDDDVPSPPPASEILRYQDPLADHQSALHAAVANGHREVAWLLLLMASEFSELDIPALVYQEAAALGIMRAEQTGKVDIRSLRDSFGRTAEDVARESGVVWNGWIGNGRLAMP
ncbi:Hypothetical protein R9X50_00309900 [Acrodontium crateriforme]|uniref:Uncharacterized protein n=1 Tax=Acrodontium crateriforme TaxID=150365 RepID=A0AAQ3M3Q5_9PEZI|nr:Hypothetical protein R9X50_00309900 [Acrodontium crateriforme]